MNDWKQWDVTVHSERDHRYYIYRSVVARSKQEAQDAVWNMVKGHDPSIVICPDQTRKVVEQKLGALPA